MVDAGLLLAACSAMLARIGLVALVLSSIACAVETEPEVADESADAIIGGESTFSYPAVGVTVHGNATGCSATLVRPNVILLAAHCFGANRTDIAPWEFEVRKSASEKYRFPTGRGWVGDRGGAGEDDLALLRLERPVPSTVARPLTLSSEYPAQGNTMRMIGFGCTARGGGGAGTKRVVSFGWGENKDASCPGDSGGALIAYPSSKLVGVISGYRTDRSQDDLFAWVPKHLAELNRRIAALERP
jgi:hypothetical protein